PRPAVPLSPSRYGTSTGTVPNEMHFFFSYVPNSALPRGLNRASDGDIDKRHPKLVPLHALKQSSATVLMLEMRSGAEELPEIAGSDDRNRSLDRSKANWKRVAARHRVNGGAGGHYLFADGHGAGYSYEYVTAASRENMLDEVFPVFNGSPQFGYNRKDLIWDPFGPATDSLFELP
ncbi:unnamed protein product, partial [Ectocarpus fasciculatus]